MRPRKWLWLIAFLAHIVFFVGVDVLQPFLISRFINDLTNIDNKTISDFTHFLWLWVGLHVAQTTIGRVGIYAWFHAAAKTLMDIDLMSFRVTLSQGSDFFANNFTGSLVTKFNRFTRSFETLSTALMFDLNALMVQIVFPFALLLFIAPLIAVIILVWTIVFAGTLIYLHKRKLPFSKLVAEYDSKVTGVTADAITNVLSIKTFARFSNELDSFAHLGRLRVKARLRNMIFADFIRLYKVVFIIALEIPVFWLSAKYALEKRADIGQILLIQLYVQQLLRSLWDLGKIVDRLEEALADATEMAEIYELTPSVVDRSHVRPLQSTAGELIFDDITFTYDGDGENPVFKGFDLHIPVGQKVGLVGPSGGGKSTFTKLLLRFMDVDTGRILIDGQDIAHVAQDELRQNIAYVPQEPLLFHRSIYDNIAYGDPGATRSEVLRAAQLAHADEFIEKLPQGYDTLVGERGVKLSGGQKQRVAIARAMLKQAPILVLDEATSALDSKSEKHITEALDNLMKNRTTIVIAHRLSTIRKLDRVVVLSEGQIVEDGTHAGLLRAKGLYAELWAHQQGDFLEE
jgi:ATP-binding cassette subfamily B protein